MTELLYYQDPYMKECDAVIEAIDGNRVWLNRTVFYPECGGQPGDRGMIGNAHVLDTVKDDDGNPVHIVESACGLEAGMECRIRLDWDHRHEYMVKHTAQHMISATLFHSAGIGTVAVHLGENAITIETDRKDIDEAVLLEIEDIANSHIRMNRAVHRKEMSHAEAEGLGMRRSIKVDGDVMVVFIEGLDAVACGGVHVSGTSEIKEVTYVGKESIRGHVRTIWAVGDDSVSYRRMNKSIVGKASSLLSAESDGIIDSICRLRDESQSLRRRVKELERDLARIEIREHSSSPVFRTTLPIEAFQDDSSNDGSEHFIISGSGRFLYVGCRERFLCLKERLGLKGGGRDAMFSGAYPSDPDSLEREAKEFFDEGKR